jgi:hypothetical protein
MLNFTLNGALRNACTRSLKEWPQLDQPPGAGAIRLTPEHNSSCWVQAFVDRGRLLVIEAIDRSIQRSRAAARRRAVVRAQASALTTASNRS